MLFRYLAPLFAAATLLAADPAYVRVSQVGYESGTSPFRAYLMTSAPQSGATFSVVNSSGKTVYSAAAGALLGTWSAYSIYALDFNAAGAGLYTISATVNGKSIVSPHFAVNTPNTLYSGLLLNTNFFYESERDGVDYIPNALRTAPGHLNDASAKVYQTPPLDVNDMISTTGTPLTPTGETIDASGGWWDAGDYMKYVETTSYALALQEIGVRDFPNQIGPGAPANPGPPPGSISYAGAAPGAPKSADLTPEVKFGLQFLSKMWNDQTKTLYYQVGNSQDWDNFSYLSDYDIWRLPQADDDWDGCNADATFICHRPVFVAGAPGAKISPNLAGRLTADFALGYQLYRESNPALANQYLKNAEDIFALADTSFADPAASVDSGTCASGCLLTIVPFDGYPETVWDDDMELGATELYLALQCSGNPAALNYLIQATQYAHNYIAKIYNTGGADTLNLYDVSGLAHFELYRALGTAPNTSLLAVTQAGIRSQLLQQTNDAIQQASSDPWGFGAAWNSDTTSHGGGISVMASEAFFLTGDAKYDLYSRRWMANILGANAWGSSFIVGDGSATFPDCIQHQVANLAGALNGTAGGTPVLWGAASEGPAYAATSGVVGGMILCSTSGFAKFDGNGAVYRDNVQSYSTTEPAIDLTATSFLMWSWRIAGHPANP